MDILDEHTKDSDTNLDELVTLSNLNKKNLFQILQTKNITKKLRELYIKNFNLGKFIREINQSGIIWILEISFENQNFLVQKICLEVLQNFDKEKIKNNVLVYVINNIDKKSKSFLALWDRVLQLKFDFVIEIFY